MQNILSRAHQFNAEFLFIAFRCSLRLINLIWIIICSPPAPAPQSYSTWGRGGELDSTNWFRIFSCCGHFLSWRRRRWVRCARCTAARNVRQITDFDSSVSVCIVYRYAGCCLLVLHIIIIFSIHVHRPHYYFLFKNYHKGSESTTNARFVCSRAKTSIIIFVACAPCTFTRLELGTRARRT